MNSPNPKRGESEKDPEVLVYIVDDEPMLLELAKVVLEPLGYRIQTFRDAETALKAYETAPKHPTVIITDFAMHKMTGVGLIEACRRIRPRQKVVMVSGTIDEGVIQDAPSKPDIFLAKPYLADQLVDAIKKALGK